MAEVVFGTSGSTGNSKRIVRDEASLTEDAARLVAAFPEIWSARPTVVASIRPEHMYGALWRVRAPAAAGSAVDPSVIFSVEELMAAREQYGRFLFVTTPSFLEKALKHPDFPSLNGAFHAIVTSGSLLREATALAVHAVTGVCPCEIYGSTETGTIAFRRRIEGELWTLVDGVSATVESDGRLCVDSPFAMECPFVMSDLVELVSSRKFRLKGRVDRRVKILERYVSLNEVERVLSSHPLVERARVETIGTEVPRLGALLVLTDEGTAALSSDTVTAFISRLRADLRSELEGHAFPRRIRIVRELPFNEQGKTTVEAVRNELSQWCREPAVLEWRATADELFARLVFPKDLECFQGHFPEFAVLPGVAQLYFVRRFARQAFPDWPERAVYRRLKFQKLILPGKQVELQVRRLGVSAFEFSLTTDGGRCASAQIAAIGE